MPVRLRTCMAGRKGMGLEHAKRGREEETKVKQREMPRETGRHGLGDACREGVACVHLGVQIGGFVRNCES